MAKRHPVLRAFGLSVRKQREARELTQESLAEKADLDQTWPAPCLIGNMTYRLWSRSRGIRRLASVRKGSRAQYSPRSRVRKKVSAVVFEKRLRRLGEFFRQMDGLALVSYEVLLERGLGQIAFQMLAEHKAKPFIQRDQARVKCRVVKGRKAQAVLRIQPLFVGTHGPRFDVARDQQVGNRNPRDAAANTVSIENRLAKELLAAPNMHSSFRLRWTRWGRQPSTRFKSNSIRLKKVNFALIVIGEQVMKQLFAGWRKGAEIVVKLVPHHPVLPRGAFESFDAARPLHAIKRGEITQFHGETIRRASHLACDFDDSRVQAVELSEWQLAVQIERYQQVLARPFYARGLEHARRLPQIRVAEKDENTQ